jgi:small-conductance mechanosensitive channel
MDSSLEFEAVYFVTVPDYLPYMDTQQAINLALLRTFNDAGINFAFPTRTIVHQTVDGGRPGEESAKGSAGERDAPIRLATSDGGAG